MQTGISLYVRHLSLLLIAWEVGERGIVVKAAMVPIGLNYWTDASMIGMLLVVNLIHVRLLIAILKVLSTLVVIRPLILHHKSS